MALVGRPVGAPHIDPATLMRAIATYRRISVGSRVEFEAMNRAVALHRIRPVVDRVFPFAESKQALAYMEGQGHFGKIAIGLD